MPDVAYTHTLARPQETPRPEAHLDALVERELKELLSAGPCPRRERIRLVEIGVQLLGIKARDANF